MAPAKEISGKSTGSVARGDRSGEVLRRVGLCALLLCAVLIAYLPSFNGAFIWDDHALVRDNLLIRRWPFAGRFFTGDIVSGAAMDSCFYRPLQMVSYALDYSLWRLRPPGFHLTNYILHALVACAVYALIRTFAQRRTTAFLASVIFALHPVHTEAVAYISGRADILAGLFVICAFILYVRFDRDRRWTDLALCAVSFACAAFSKEYGLVLLVLVPIYHLIFRRKPRFTAVALLCLVAAGYLAARFQAVACVAESGAQSGFWQRLAGFFAAAAGYARLIILPVDLHMAYGRRVFSWTDPQVLAGAGVCAVFLFALTVLLRRQRRAEAFFLAWFAGSLLPQSNLYPLNAFMAEHWLYLPLAGICALAAHAAAALLRIRRFSWMMRAYLVAAIGVLAALTWQQAGTWRTSLEFFERTARFAPADFAVQIGLGRAYSEAGQCDRAIAALSRARDIAPSHPRAYSNLAEAYQRCGDEERARDLYLRAIELAPAHDKAYINLGVLYEGRKEYARALEMYLAAARINPRSRAAHFNLGNVYLAQGRFSDAVDSYRRAIEIDPDHGPAWNNLSIALIGVRDYPQAIRACDRAAALGVINRAVRDALQPHR